MPTDSNSRSGIKIRLDHDLKCKSDAGRLSQATQIINKKNMQPARNENKNNAAEHEVDSCSIDVHNKQSVLDLFEDKLEVEVTNISLALAMSSITGLTDLIEDEIIPRPIALQVCFVLPFFFNMY